MSVYVDDFYTPFRGMHMCHMLADSAEELHAMADLIGLKRSWFQGDHYDVSETKRALAVRAGAIEVTSREIVKVRRRWWDRYSPDSLEAKRARVLDEMEDYIEEAQAPPCEFCNGTGVELGKSRHGESPCLPVRLCRRGCKRE